MLRECDFTAYAFEEKQDLKELRATGYVLRHKKSGARVLLIENEYENKVFSIAFRTPPTNDTGVAHIMEHSTLCGSRKFPSKDPFIELAKGSLNTFLNAMTYPDKTVYPIASCNDKDYHNLMDVYLDAVFHPNIYQKPEIMEQEGWHYEMDDKNDSLKFNGVVYNEMKGVYSDPEALLERRIQNVLLPDTTYAYESGGDPDCIPQLTREDFLAFHQKFYHPSNSYIYLYGNVDFKKELDYIDKEYLSNYDYQEVDSEIALQKPFSTPIEYKDTYSVGSDFDEDGVYLTYNVVAGSSCDNKLTLAMQILDYVLFSMPGAPIKQKMIDAGIGKDFDSFYDSSIQQPIFSISAKKAAPGEEKHFLRVLTDALKEVVDKGIDKKAVYSIINSLEFKYREANFGRFPKGLIYGLNFLSSWLYDDKKALEIADSLTPLAELKKEVESGYFENLIKTYLLDNPHKAYVALYPEKGKNERLEEQLKDQLARVKASLNEKQLYYLERQTKKLRAFQETPSTQEELEKIPLLELSDIKRDPMPFSNKEMTIGGIPVVAHDYETNGIIYFDFYFDCTELPEELIPYMTLLVDVLRDVDTEHFKYNDLASEIGLKVGGLTFGTGITPLAWKHDGYRPFFSIKMKCLKDQVQDGMNLIKEILFTTKLSDTKRIKEIISELATKMESRIPSSGNVFAANRAMSYVNPQMRYKESAEGIEYFDFLRDFDKHYLSKKDTLVKQLTRALHCIFRKENLTVGLTGQFDFKALLEDEFAEFGKELFKEPCVKSVPNLPMGKLNEGIKTSSKVQYSAAVGSFYSPKRPFTGALNVLKTIFSYDYLWVNVRVTGGAYGCGCGFTRDGYGYFTSYRDPHLKDTYEVYQKAADYVKDFDVDDRDMRKYIIGTISSMDQPLEPVSLGDRSFVAYQSGITIETLAHERQQVLNCSQEDIRALAPYIQAIIDTQAICTIGNEAKIEAEAEIFNNVRTLS